jgi:hypothetical protein
VTSPRINRLYPGLTAVERGRLVLQAWKEGREEDLLIRTSMPAKQVTEFNRLIGIMNAVNHHLVGFIVVVCAQVDMLSLRLGWFLTLQLWLMNEDQVPEPTDGGRSRWDDLADILAAAIRSGIAAQWRELLAIERVVGEAAAEFGVEDPALPTVRELVDSIRSELIDMKESAGRYIDEIDLPEANDERLGELRELACLETQ